MSGDIDTTDVPDGWASVPFSTVAAINPRVDIKEKTERLAVGNAE